MLRHIVMIKFNERENLEENSKYLKKLLMDLENSIDSLNKMQVGINFSTRPSAHDIVLIADFDNEAGLDEYRIHPEHVKVLDFLKEKGVQSTVVDYFN
ncbi:MAG: stress responsive protein [Marinilabiliales bacterium]|nr:MAG: stress responsive protein [Marinilabiliales bacterium]